MIKTYGDEPTAPMTLLRASILRIRMAIAIAAAVKAMLMKRKSLCKAFELECKMTIS